MVHRIVLKFEKIWLSRTLNVIGKPRKFLFSNRKRAITQELYMCNAMYHKIQIKFDYGEINIYCS